MKPLPSIALLAASLGVGAFAHHLNESNGARPNDSPRPSKIAPAPRAATSLRQQIAALAATLRELSERPGADWRAISEKLSALPAEHYPGLWGALREDLFDTLHWELLRCWAAADAAGLLRAAENEDYGLSLEAVLDRCVHDYPAQVAAAMEARARRRAEETDAGEEEITLLWRAALGTEFQNHPAQGITLIASAGAAKYFSGTGMLYEALAKWVAIDAPAAMRVAESHPELVRPALEGWLARDPDAAFAWMATHPQQEGDWMNPGLMKYATQHPLEAERFYSRIESDVEELSPQAKLSFRTAQAEGMAWRPVEESAAWLNTLSGDERAAAGRIILQTIIQFDSRLAVAVCKAVPDITAGGKLDKDAFQEFAKFHAPEAAATLAAGTVPEAMRARCLPVVMDSWLMADRSAALEFIAREPVSELKGQLLLLATGLSKEGGPEAVRAFALTLSDPVLRLGACRHILEATTYSGSAEEWIATIPDPALRRALQQVK